MADEWLEVRCTQADFLPALGQEPPEGAPSFEGVLSVVIESSDKRMRRLPSIYFGPSLVFTSRKPEELKQHLERALELLRRAPEEPTYALTPVRLDDHVGLYARDMAIRDTFRVYLRRSGVVFAEEPFVNLSDKTSFVGAWGDFVPEFIILGHYDPDEPEKVLETSGAFVPFTLAKFRLGSISPPELKQLVAAAREPLALSSASPTELVGALRARFGS